MALDLQQEQLGKHLDAGARHHRAWVGSPDNYDLSSALQFCLLTSLGLRENHTLLDIGCGSLRGGRLALMYLLPERYFGIEPEGWLIEAGIQKEIGQDLVDLKKPSFNTDGNFTLSVFQRSFDYLIAQSVFSHATQAQIHRCLEEATKVMTPSSLFITNFMEGPDNYSGDEWVYPGCSEFTMDFMTKLVESHGLLCKPIAWPHPIGLSWIVIHRPEYTGDALEITQQPAFLKGELNVYKRQLRQLQQNPYVKIALSVKQAVAKLRGQFSR
ncbi:MAG: class I SAM-dependent methyltransferase [Roseiflexaceae bacterium]